MIDDATALYIQQVHPPFEDLKLVASQIAGLLVLAAAGAKSAAPDHPMLLAAEERYRASADAILSTKPTDRARHHQRHLTQAAALLKESLSAARIRMDVEATLIPLRAAYTELESAAASLPGFEMISFDNACCARKPNTGAKPGGKNND